MSDTNPGGPYIFCIGFNKTGTSTLDSFFRSNGIASVHWDEGRLAKNMVSNLVEGRKIFEGYDQIYRAFSDMTFLNHRVCIEGNGYFRIMDSDYPGSLFIYNTRGIHGWIRSRINHGIHGYSFAERYKSLLNTSDQGVVERYWIDQRLSFEKEIMEYFLYSDRFMVLDIESTNAAPKLAAFLGRDVDLATWGHVNQTAPAAP